MYKVLFISSLKIMLFVLAISAFNSAIAQHNNPFTANEDNFYKIQAEFESFYKNAENPEMFREWKQYKRWEWFMAPRVYPSGNLPDPMAIYKELNKPMPSRSSNYRSTGSWTSLGPNVSSGVGIGRINFVCVHPTDSNIIFAGAPSGGLWKTTNGGASWTTNTDKLTAIGFSDMVINPLNPQIMYAASGDGDASDSYSLGILKSTDGGETWATTGLNFSITQTRTIRRLIMHPDNPDILFAATNNGIYKTINAGDSWTRVYNSASIDIEFKPGNPSVVYAAAFAGSWTAGAKFLRSTDNGNTLKGITGDWNNKSNRIAIAVAPSDSNYVYIIASVSPSYNNDRRHGFLGFYRSDNGGDSFTTMATSHNILGWTPTGNDSRGQGRFDLDLAVSPVNKDLVFIGGVNIWKTENGGSNWTLAAHWYGGGGAPYVHADIHWLSFDKKSPFSLYIGCDGGIYTSKSNGKTYKDITQTIVNSQVYKLGASATDPKLVLMGLQDNGTKLLSNTSWSAALGGDGMECIVDPSDNKIMYGSLYYGDIRKSTNGGQSFSDIKGNIAEEGGWVTPFILSPLDPKKIYAGYENVWVNNNRGSGNWYKLGSIPGTSKIVDIKIAPSDTSVIYVAKSSALYISRDNGKTWKNINSGLPVSSASIEAIEIRHDNANVVWVTFSGYSASNKVFVSTDGGTNWINFSGNLPNLPVNCIVYQKNSDNGLYVGTDAGVYYRDSSLNNWIPFSDGLPNVIVSELEIYYNSNISKQRIKASTYGRGLWESELYFSPNVSAKADFEVSDSNICSGYTLTFNNTSSFANNYKWYFPGGNPSESTDRNPRVRYDAVGKYTVHLVAINDYGKDSVLKSDLITVQNTSICEYIMPQLSSGDIYTTCSGILLDPGGFNNYGSNLNTVVSIAPPDAVGLIFKFTEFDTESEFDMLEIFEGTTVNGKKIGAFSGSNLPGNGLLVSVTGAVTLRFTTDALDNRSGFMCEWKCIKPDEAPYAYFIPETTYSCNGLIKFENLSLSNPDQILWDFGDGTQSSIKNPIHLYSSNGNYTVTMVASNSFGSDTFTVKNIVIDLPETPIPYHASVCGSGTVNLSAEGIGNIYWFYSKNDSLSFYKGHSFTTPVLNNNTSYYIRKFTPGTSEYVGAYSNSIGSGSYNTGTGGLSFHAINNLILKSVKVYASGSGKRTIQLKDSSGATIFDTSIQLTNGENRIYLNIDVPKGKYYTLLAISASMYRNNAGVSYPYQINNLISIYTSTTGLSYYNFFYDWEVQKQDVCKSPYIEIRAGVYSTSPKASFNYKDSGIYVSFTNSSTNNFINMWDFGDGTTSTEQNPTHKYAKGGTYTVKLKTINGCGSDSVSTTLNLVNSIEKNESGVYRIYPNPSNGNFSLEYQGAALLHLRITDISGYILYEMPIKKSGNSLRYNLNRRLNPGIYFIHLTNEISTVTEKLIVQ